MDAAQHELPEPRQPPLFMTNRSDPHYDRNYDLLSSFWFRVAKETMHVAPSDPANPGAKGVIGPFPASIWRYIYRVGKLQTAHNMAAVCKSMLLCICVGRYDAVVRHRTKVLEAISIQVGVMSSSVGYCKPDALIQHFVSPHNAHNRDSDSSDFISSVVMSVVYLDSPAFWWLPKSAARILCPSKYVPRPSECRSLFMARNHYNTTTRDALQTMQAQVIGGKLNTSYVQSGGVRFRSRSLLYDLAREPLMRMVSPGLQEFWVSIPSAIKPMRVSDYPDDISNIMWRMDNGVMTPTQDMLHITPRQSAWMKGEMAAYGSISPIIARTYGITRDQIAAWLLRHPKAKKVVNDGQATLVGKPAAKPADPPSPVLGVGPSIVPPKRKLTDLMADSSEDSDIDAAKNNKPENSVCICRCRVPSFSGVYCTKCNLPAFY